MCQVNGGWSFLATWGSETPEPIHLKSGMCNYVHSPTPHTKYGGRRKWGVGWAYGWSCTLRAFFLKISGPFNASTAYPEKHVDFRSVHPKTCFGGGCDLPRGQIFPFLPQKHFSMGRIRLSFCMGVNRKHPLWLMIAP